MIPNFITGSRPLGIPLVKKNDDNEENDEKINKILKTTIPLVFIPS